MSSEFDRRLDDWFDAVEPRHVPPDILAHALGEARATGQMRAPWHRFAATLESAWTTRTSLAPGMVLAAIALILVVALAGAAVGAGLVSLPSPPPVVDGLIAVEGQLQLSDTGGATAATRYVIRFIDPETGEDVFTTPTDVKACGAHFSPDGSQYAFIQQIPDVTPAGEVEAGPSGARYRELWTVPVDGTPARRLTDIRTSYSADWSSSGDWIAFLALGAEDQAPPLYLIRPDGTDLRMLRTSAVGTVAWSPLRDELAYTASDGRLHVVTVDGEELLATADLRDPATPDELPGGPVWSPDATRIALVVPGGALEVFDVATGSMTQVPTPSPVTHEGSSRYGRPVWSADGRSLIMVTDDGALWEVAVDGSQQRLIADHVQDWCMSASYSLSWQQLAR